MPWVRSSLISIWDEVSLIVDEDGYMGILAVCWAAWCDSAVGCSNLVPPSDAWLRRTDNEATIGCYTTRQRWNLRCDGNQWTGTIGLCSNDGLFMHVINLLCIVIAFVLRIWFYSFFIRAVFSAVFSLTVLSGLLFLLIDFFLVLLSMANKDSFIHSFIHYACTENAFFVHSYILHCFFLYRDSILILLRYFTVPFISVLNCKQYF